MSAEGDEPWAMIWRGLDCINQGVATADANERHQEGYIYSRGAGSFVVRMGPTMRLRPIDIWSGGRNEYSLSFEADLPGADSVAMRFRTSKADGEFAVYRELSEASA